MDHRSAQRRPEGLLNCRLGVFWGFPWSSRNRIDNLEPQTAKNIAQIDQSIEDVKMTTGHHAQYASVHESRKIQSVRSITNGLFRT